VLQLLVFVAKIKSCNNFRSPESSHGGDRCSKRNCINLLFTEHVVIGGFLTCASLAGNVRERSTITSHSHPSNPQSHPFPTGRSNISDGDRGRCDDDITELALSRKGNTEKGLDVPQNDHLNREHGH
jgi:hypothetical protein